MKVNLVINPSNFSVCQSICFGFVFFIFWYDARLALCLYGMVGFVFFIFWYDARLALCLYGMVSVQSFMTTIVIRFFFSCLYWSQ